MCENLILKNFNVLQCLLQNLKKARISQKKEKRSINVLEENKKKN
jgi:hypothetical protein